MGPRGGRSGCAGVRRGGLWRQRRGIRRHTTVSGSTNTARSDDHDAPTADGGTLTFAAYSQIAGLDPLVALGSGTSGAIQMAAVYDTLVRYDIETKKYTPRLAESFTANADSTEWTAQDPARQSSSPTAPTSTPKRFASA